MPYAPTDDPAVIAEQRARRRASVAKYNASAKHKAKNRAYSKRRREALCGEPRDTLLQYHRDYRRQAKIAAMSGYSASGTPECACCGEGAIEFLSIDHVNNDGNIERRKLGSRGRGLPLYLRIIEAKWPAEYQVLCFNCNLAKGFFGYCPHKRPQ